MQKKGMKWGVIMQGMFPQISDILPTASIEYLQTNLWFELVGLKYFRSEQDTVNKTN